jgi:hypothetical protein
MEKTSYISPSQGELNLTIDKGTRPFVSIFVDLGIPNFTIFTIKIPLISESSEMRLLIDKAMDALLDEIIAFMLSMNFHEDVCTHIYALILDCYRNLNNSSDTESEFSGLSKDDNIKLYTGNFNLPDSFVSETQEKVVTAATTIKRAPAYKHFELTPTRPNKATLGDAAKVIRQFRNKSLKHQPQPLYLILYDQKGRSVGAYPVARTPLLRRSSMEGTPSEKLIRLLEKYRESAAKSVITMGEDDTTSINKGQLASQSRAFKNLKRRYRKEFPQANEQDFIEFISTKGTEEPTV